MNGFEFKSIKPPKSLADFVDSFWMLHNTSDKVIDTTGLPDGLIDLSLSKSAQNVFRIVQLGIQTQNEQTSIPAGCLIFCISFKLLAVEHLFGAPVADIVNSGRILPDDFWDFSEGDLQDFSLFTAKSVSKIQSILPEEIDSRKQKLFELIYASKGAVTVRELSEKADWSSRQINRYFNHQFGISLKAYCNVLRFRVSLEHIAKGKLFPEQNFTDQNHFIKAVKKFSGVVPKELSKNKNDRFILLSAINSK